MIFYHGTSEENWKKIQEEGILFGKKYIRDRNGNLHQSMIRCTYLDRDKMNALSYGRVLLKVEYNPHKHPLKNDYNKELSQFIVYEPIPIKYIQRIEESNFFIPEELC